MIADAKCPVCGDCSKLYLVSDIKDNKEHHEYLYICPHCGAFQLPNERLLSFIFGEKENLYNLKCFLYENREKHDEYHPIRLDQNVLEKIFQMSPITVEEKVEKLLTYISNHSSYFGENVSVVSEVIYSRSKDELINLLKELAEQDYIDDKLCTDSNLSASIKIKGIKQIKQKNEEEKKGSCFIAMWFAPEMSEIYKECIIPACIESGYSPIRVDSEQFNGDITDRIIANIRTTHFTIADLTGYRGGVYYEAGFAAGLGKEVILTCREDWFNGDSIENKRVHFDVNHLNIIQWKDSEKETFKQQLMDRIIATMGKGTYSPL